ncbi:hypothetical protein PF004_g5785 [Phytophthora fragariae]|uniref:Uncharacterized protein n=1 Tax=Phytophthora fragariae TaxID=53985 RepID=A0A6G0PEW0_9STRA|nr:hypothetical protein PF004_g5785 [Phytophthora fragariae]
MVQRLHRKKEKPEKKELAQEGPTKGVEREVTGKALTKESGGDEKALTSQIGSCEAEEARVGGGRGLPSKAKTVS